MKGWVVYSVFATAIAVVAIGVAVGLALSREGSGQSASRPTDQATAAARRLTASEAAAKVHAYLMSNAKTAQDRSVALGFVCTGKDFNVSDRAWIVVCAAISNGSVPNATFSVDDDSGVVRVIG